MQKIAIVGAGPAGLQAAIELSKAGFSVDIFDPKVPWDKPCGGLLSRETIEEFDVLDLLDDDQKTKCEGIWFESPDGEKTYRSLKKPFYSVSRSQLGQAMLELATDFGANFKKEFVTKIVQGGNGFTVKSSADTYYFDILIGADGVNSIVRKTLLSRISKKDLGLTCGYNIPNGLKTDFTFKYLPYEGYIWIIPGPIHTNIGIGTKLGELGVKRSFEILNQYLETFSDKPSHFVSWRCLVPYVRNSNFYELTTSGNNWALIGDAAGHVDPVTVEGIYYALKSGNLIADAIIDKNLSKYKVCWKSAYGDFFDRQVYHMNGVQHLGTTMGGSIIGNILYNNSITPN